MCTCGCSPLAGGQVDHAAAQQPGPQRQAPSPLRRDRRTQRREKQRHRIGVGHWLRRLRIVIVLLLQNAECVCKQRRSDAPPGTAALRLQYSAGCSRRCADEVVALPLIGQDEAVTKQFRVEQNRTGMVGQPLHLLHEEGAETVSCCWDILQQPAKSNSSRFISCALMPRLVALLWVFYVKCHAGVVTSGACLHATQLMCACAGTPGTLDFAPHSCPTACTRPRECCCCRAAVHRAAMLLTLHIKRAPPVRARGWR